MAQQILTHRVDESDSGDRLDRCLASIFTSFSRTRLKALIESGAVCASGRTITEPSYRVKLGEILIVNVPDAVAAEPAAQDIALEIRYEDDDLLVVDKPAGLVVHPGTGNRQGTLANALLHHFQSISRSETIRPGIVHRLDKATSGLMVVAKNDQAHEILAHQFKDRQVEKRYLALVYGCVKEAEGIIDVSLGRDPFVRTKISTRSRRSRKALTRYQTIRNYRDFSYLRIYPHTGRTHQIRVHFQHLGHPVVGDETYGGKAIQRVQDPHLVESIQTLNRYFLHADSLAFVHPDTGERVSFEIPLPDALAELLRALK